MNNTEYLLNCDAIYIIMNDIKSNHIVERTFKNSHIELYNIIIDFWDDNIIPKNFLEKVYSYVNNEKPICERGNRKRFEYYNSGYKGCSQRCECVKKKYQTTMLRNHGVVSPLQNKKIKNKMYNTFKKKYGVDKLHLINQEQRKNTNIMKYGVEYPLQSNVIQEQTKSTNLKRYGAEKPFQSQLIQDQIKIVNSNEEIKNKKNKTLMDRYGVSCYLIHNEARKQNKKVMLKKYGSEYLFQSEWYKKVKKTEFYNNLTERTHGIVTPLFSIDEYHSVKERMPWKCNICNNIFSDHLDNGRTPKCHKCYPLSESKGEREVKEFLKSLNINIIENDRTIIKPKELDIVIPEKKLAIEYCGLYWHSDLHKLDNNYHKNKLAQSNKQGYRLITIFEDEWVNKPEICKARLKLILKIDKIKIDNDQLIIKEVKNNRLNNCLTENNINGVAEANIKICAYYNNEIISVMAFNYDSRANKYELLRICNKDNTPEIGSKLFNYFVSHYNPREIISYCDLRWETGEFYESLGFKLNTTIEPKCWHIDSKTISRLEKIADPEEHGRIWDCGKTKWVWNNTNKEM